MKRDSAEINRVVNSTLRNSTVDRSTNALKTSRFTTDLEVGRFMVAPEKDRFRPRFKKGDALSRRDAQAIGPAVKIF